MSVRAQDTEKKAGRLDSWKAIAEYLGRDVRSVQRWECERGLPVHRIPGAKGGGVFAYTEELEGWLNSRADGQDSQKHTASSQQELVSPRDSTPPASAQEVAPAQIAPSHAFPKSIKGVYAIVFLALVAALLGVFLLIADRFKQPSVRNRATRPMLAVLPFTNLSGDPSQNYFADGLTEELITDIGRLDPAGLGVIARTSSMKYKNTNKDAAQIGRELGVDYILEGSVRREQGVARISAQLIQVKDQSHLWAQNYQQNVEHILAVQRDVAAAVADKIRVRLLAPRDAINSEAATSSPEAFDNYLEGLYFANQRNVAGLSQATNFFTRAIALDPSYAAAYAGLAQCYTLLAIDNIRNPEEMERKAKETAAKAVALNDASAQAHVILAGTKVLFDFDWPGAEAHFQRALALNPNNALAHHWYAILYLAPRGRYQEAIAEMKVAQQLDPMSLIINTDLGYAQYLAGQDDAAVAQFHHVLEMNPDFVPAHYDLSTVYGERRMYAEAIHEVAEDLKISGEPERARALQEVYNKSGYPGVQQVIASSEGKSGGGSRPSLLAIAHAYLFLGKTEQALHYLELAYEDRDSGVIYLKADPAWKDLRSEARFQAIERKVGLVD